MESTRSVSYNINYYQRLVVIFMFIKNKFTNNNLKIKKKFYKKYILEKNCCIDLSSFLFKNNIIYLGLPISEKVNELVLIELLLLTFLNKKKSLLILINSSQENFHYYPYQFSHLSLITCIDYINQNFNFTKTVVIGKSFGSSMYFLTTLNRNTRFIKEFTRCSFKNATLSIDAIPYYFYNKNDFTYKKTLIETKKILNNLYYLSANYTMVDHIEKNIHTIGPSDALRLGILDTILN